MQLTLLSSLMLCGPSLASTISDTLAVPLIKSTRLSDENGVVCKKTLVTQLAAMSSKMQRGFLAFERNTGAVHPSNSKRLEKRAMGSVPLTDTNDALWYGNISVGTPAVSFKVDFDTGSSDLFLPGNMCRVNCQGHQVYNTNVSSTARDIGRNFSLAFGDGSTVRGDQFRDTVTIAGLTVTGQTVGAATQYSTGFSIDSFAPDGLMGMAFPQISEFGANPVFQTLVTQGKAPSPMFGFKLAPAGSELFLGGVNNKLFNGTITQNPVTQEGFWQVNLDAVSVNGSAIVRGLSAIVDTGTSLVLGDTSSVAKIYASIPGAKNASSTIGQGFFTVPCNSIPSVSLTFGRRPFVVSADTFNLGRVSQGSPDCVGGITAADLGDFWIVGDVFLRNVYTVFDVGNKTVGFANLV